MIRTLVVLCGFALAAAGSVRLRDETRYLLRADQPVAVLLESEGAAGVVFVFQPEDCLSNGEMVQRWNQLRLAGAVPVKGLVAGAALSPRQRDLFARRDLQLPLGTITAQDAAIVAEKLGYRATPFAVVLDRHGRVAATFPAEQNVAPEIVQRLVRGD